LNSNTEIVAGVETAREEGVGRRDWEGEKKEREKGDNRIEAL